MNSNQQVDKYYEFLNKNKKATGAQLTVLHWINTRVGLQSHGDFTFLTSKSFKVHEDFWRPLEKFLKQQPGVEEVNVETTTSSNIRIDVFS